MGRGTDISLFSECSSENSHFVKVDRVCDYLLIVDEKKRVAHPRLENSLLLFQYFINDCDRNTRSASTRLTSFPKFLFSLSVTPNAWKRY